MSSQAMDFIKNGDPTFRRKIDGCLVSFSSMMDTYRKHIIETPKEEQKAPSEFLSNDYILEMMIKDFDCHDSALHVMKKYSEAILD
ncbi:MAG: hypothetical protein QG566_39 [Patescibacteria group bacterium]|jgi:hypothetical protein|nr:hypothetical protein [Patescibacteria group bacterium]